MNGMIPPAWTPAYRQYRDALAKENPMFAIDWPTDVVAAFRTAGGATVTLAVTPDVNEDRSVQEAVAECAGCTTRMRRTFPVAEHNLNWQAETFAAEADEQARAVAQELALNALTPWALAHARICTQQAPAADRPASAYARLGRPEGQAITDALHAWLGAPSDAARQRLETAIRNHPNYREH